MKLCNAKIATLLISSICLQFSNTVLADIQHLDDVIIDGSACVGFDCVNGESFGFDTLRLKENNLRIHFDDTSNSASFAKNDWRIVINDTSNGGSEYFAIEDSTAGRLPFRIDAGAPANALRVDSAGDVGLGTASPVTELHIADGDSPTIRLEQNGASGFTQQTWDMAGNEANFFIRDVTNGSKLVFRIKPSAPTNSIYIAADGNVGMGTENPQAKLHLRSSKADINLESTSSTNTPTWRIVNNSDTLRFSVPGSGVSEATLDNQGNFTNSGTLFPSDIKLINGPTTWRVVNSFNEYKVSVEGSGKVESKLDTAGNLSITGTLSQGSSRSFKTNINPIDVQSIVDKLASLPMATWSYLNATDVLHIGPMAEDFYNTFNFGPDEKHIAPGDMAAIALVTAQKLNSDAEVLKEQLKAKDEEISKLQTQMAQLYQRMLKLENQ